MKNETTQKILLLFFLSKTKSVNFQKQTINNHNNKQIIK